MRYRISPPPPGPARGIVTALVGMFMLAASLLFGFLVFLVALGVLAGFAVYVWIRSRWGGRAGSSARYSGRGSPRGKQASGGEEIEGEYTVVSRRRE